MRDWREAPFATWAEYTMKDMEKGKKMRMRVGDKLKDYQIGFREHAHWIDDGGKMLIVQKYKCSNCGNRSAEKSNFCSFCGARMDEDEKTKR